MQNNINTVLTDNSNDRQLSKWRSNVKWQKGDHGPRYSGVVRKRYNKALRRSNKVKI